MLERFDAPFTVYVTTNLIERAADTIEGTEDLRWLALERLFRRRQTVDITPMGRRFIDSRGECPVTAL